MCSAVGASCIFIWIEWSPLMGFAFFKSFSIRGDSEHIPGFLAGCCIKYLPEKKKEFSSEGPSLGSALQKACAFTVLAMLPVCYISYPSLVPVSPCWIFSCCVKILVNTTDLLSASRYLSSEPALISAPTLILPPSREHSSSLGPVFFLHPFFGT